ncbi:Leucine-rich receptor-like protein kinase family protein [Hibiscus syriacus]|uniref:Leucine-rich receptor-like protein kinase family protein n=1 Tax=Hibiscus syriacus TaxID=106335 RepID=A0A6A2Z7A8_HIBSY|nr:Leucine-rich receptor-like protein kinase family protein [Hibiscus syriacus]
MAGSSVTLPIQETDVTVLKETLRSQQQLLQKLYSELEFERESSATATNESLSMILRLQSEKAAVKMEASQYKRLAEEKIGHAEEALAILEELIYQKEMEISSLEFQVQAYRYKLLSLGCHDDLNDFEKQFTPNRFTERNDAFDGEKGIKSTVRRLSSLPASLPIDFYSKKSTNDGENNLAPVQESKDAGNSDTVVRDQGLSSRRSSLNSGAGEFISYLEQIRLLDEKVKQIADCKEVDLKKISNGKVESVSLKSSLLNECHEIRSHEDSTELRISSSALSSSVVHDIFEVPVIHEIPETSAKSKSCFDGEKCNGKSVLGSDDRLRKPDLILEDNLGLPAKDEVDWIKMNNFLSAKPEGKLCSGNDLPAEYRTECVKVNKLLTTDADCKSTLRHLAAGVTDYQSELKQLSRRIEKLESGRNNTRHEIVEGREEELNLLKDLREQLNSIQAEMRSRKPKKPPSPSDEVSLVPLTEV